MTRLRWTKDNRFTDPEYGVDAAGEGIYDVPDDRVDDYLEHPSGGWERPTDDDGGTDADTDTADADADDADADADTESDAPVDPSDFTVKELESHLEDADYTVAELNAISDRERDGKERGTALDALSDARDEIKKSEE